MCQRKKIYIQELRQKMTTDFSSQTIQVKTQYWNEKKTQTIYNSMLSKNISPKQEEINPDKQKLKKNSSLEESYYKKY